APSNHRATVALRGSRLRTSAPDTPRKIARSDRIGRRDNCKDNSDDTPPQPPPIRTRNSGDVLREPILLTPSTPLSLTIIAPLQHRPCEKCSESARRNKAGR